ncbi:hypothetical protein HPP92_027211 [Vanilla planifolia]|uniref:Uncharacterized protein n=1 Tax=Vanilla planifolia TaxID=51239 RepID=A0A835U6F1_VANPL|nr:hypothetical protein HPP92_027211 [Vanilla planifolia]
MDTCSASFSYALLSISAIRHLFLFPFTIATSINPSSPAATAAATTAAAIVFHPPPSFHSRPSTKSDAPAS